ncbi:hypothetical protein P280DRAFT_286137 [Massarina eburnea CBS 473.64]|uniref:Uncharacterized protein n=1 Tax=Massarina eburnea CBS 473.64 TaxID=1395130 RepID=A0A6A6S3W8_9PLEO|nr:hypothetical protein P280DRAFT_286137 [Massarina eburnea CBS 473.64]
MRKRRSAKRKSGWAAAADLWDFHFHHATSNCLGLNSSLWIFQALSLPLIVAYLDVIFVVSSVAAPVRLFIEEAKPLLTRIQALILTDLSASMDIA